MRWKVNENATELFNIGCNHFCNSVIHIDGETFFAELSKTRDVLHYKFYCYYLLMQANFFTLFYAIANILLVRSV